MQTYITVAAAPETYRDHTAITLSGRESLSRRLTVAEFLVLFIAVVCVVAVALYPGIRTRTASWPSTVTIKVSEAETLWGIAKTHPIEGLSTAETVAAIRRNNELADSGLQQGQLLRVPGEVTPSAAMASR
ncbi:MAG: hypothetical protein CVT66_00400 [Actinobacteria bacterium HGW-Actinobacteria-6]|nr:MAG: hypothetical protein CVT66_00400 [Actinobacteria bacterium HGW-Actinobacteria-6]